jgi:hypothetical protein
MGVKASFGFAVYSSITHALITRVRPCDLLPTTDLA